MVRYAAEFGMTLRRVPASPRHLMTRSKKTAPPAISDAATQYAQEVASGKRIAGPHVRDQCARHLRDVKAGTSAGWCGMWPNLKWHRVFCRRSETERRRLRGKPFELLPWQKFVVGSLFGWKGIDGYRRFRVAYVETAKGSGKSPWLPVSA